MYPFKDFVSEARKVHGNKFKYDKSSWRGIKQKVRILCPVHGSFEQVARDHLSFGCAMCRGRSSFNRRIVTQKSFLEEIKPLASGKYGTHKVKYVNATTKVELVCPEHGSFWLRPDQVRRGHGCRKCAINARKLGRSALVAKINERHKHIDTSLVEANDNLSRYDLVTLRCKKHGVIFKKNTQEVLMYDTGCCPECVREAKQDGQKASSVTREDYITRVRNLYGSQYTYDKVPDVLPLPDTITVCCKDHGYFEVDRNNHLFQNSICPKCRKSSFLEWTVANWFPTEVVERNKRTYLSEGKEIDVYFPEHRLAVEVNGEYFHSERTTPRNYHLEKSEMAKQAGITLLHFWGWEIKNKPKIVKSMLASRLGLNDRVYARNLDVRQVESKECAEFIEENHLQGNSKASVRLGLYQGKELYMVATFAKPRFSKEAEWELIRLATRCGYTVVGGASRLLKTFERRYSPTKLLSYSDLRYSEGKVYQALGFELVRKAAPNYFWAIPCYPYRLSRYQTQKHKLPSLFKGYRWHLPKGCTELSALRSIGGARVFDCGNLVFIKTYEKGKYEDKGYADRYLDKPIKRC